MAAYIIRLFAILLLGPTAILWIVGCLAYTSEIGRMGVELVLLIIGGFGLYCVWALSFTHERYVMKKVPPWLKSGLMGGTLICLWIIQDITKSYLGLPENYVTWVFGFYVTGISAFVMVLICGYAIWLGRKTRRTGVNNHGITSSSVFE